MTTQEQIKKNEQEIERLEEEPQTEPRLGQSYRYIYLALGVWQTNTDRWGGRPIDHDRLKSGTCFWQGTEAEQEAEAQRAILRCRYVLENQWKPKQGQEVWCWDAYGGVGNSTFNWNLKGMVRSLNEGFYSPSKQEAEKRRDEFMSAFVPEGVK